MLSKQALALFREHLEHAGPSMWTRIGKPTASWPAPG